MLEAAVAPLLRALAQCPPATVDGGGQRNEAVKVPYQSEAHAPPAKEGPSQSFTCDTPRNAVVLDGRPCTSWNRAGQTAAHLK